MRSKTANSRVLPPIVVGCGKATVLALTIASLAWFAFFAKALLLKYPLVWPDEAFFANPAINLLHHGRMSTDLLDGTLPGIGQHTYWMPPLYFLYIASVFRFTGPGLVPLRLASTAAALAVLVLTYLLAVRSGLGRWLSLLPVSLVAIDVVFLRGALTGRMDMLTLFFILLSLWLATKSAAPWNSFLTGIVCALAALTHPVGAVAPVAVVAWRLLQRETRMPRSFLPLLIGILIPFLPWLAYILVDPQSFMGQFGAQLARKSARHASLSFPIYSFFNLIAEYAFKGRNLIDFIWVLPLWFVGMAGLGDTELNLRPDDSLARRSLLLLCGFQALTIAVILWGSETWYTVYVIPVTAIGLCHLLNNGRSVKSLGSERAVITAVVLVWISVVLCSNLQHASRLDYLQNVVYRSETDYSDWSSQISGKIPPGSKVLLSIIPDPYFGLMGRSDLSLREFLPEKIPINHDIYWRYMSQADYVIVGIGVQSPSAMAEEFLRSNGTLIDTVGRKAGNGYFARIYRVNRSTTR
jgi:4-amino-4-deoxy-L-arabinose transferase-like glycosyltransferase